MKITIIAGARPNFMKIAPIIHELIEAKAKGYNIEYRLVHTGQHYDHKMSEGFFEELNIPRPHVNLGAGGGSQAEQAAAIMVAFEKELIENPADIVIVVGDVTSTMACSIVAKKCQTKVGHVEAGIRSFDLTMPEEINRLVTDSITDYFFTTSEFANENLRKAGVQEERIFFVGNVMIDTLLKNQLRFKKPSLVDSLELQNQNYFVLTLHRPANVDDPASLKLLLEKIVEGTRRLPLIFPMHPRTAKIFKEFVSNFPTLHVVEPMGYLEFNYLVKNAKAVITDSGGITEETTVMRVPCITLRNSTERPETITIGTNELIGVNPQNILPVLEKLFKGEWKKGNIPDKWDGEAAKRIVEQLLLLK